jgi:hypothetical protein
LVCPPSSPGTFSSRATAALHHLGRLQHERQDQLARAELVADLLHRRQQQHTSMPFSTGHRGPVLDRPGRSRTPLLDPVLLAVQDLPVQRLLRLHVGRRIDAASSSTGPMPS